MATIEQEIEIIKGNQKAHDERDVERFASVHTTLRDMKDNHLFHIEKDMAQLKDDVSGLKEDASGLKVDMGWLKWGVTALLGGVGVIFIALVLRGL
jgi:hypothetical protein